MSILLLTLLSRLHCQPGVIGSVSLLPVANVVASLVLNVPFAFVMKSALEHRRREPGRQGPSSAPAASKRLSQSTVCVVPPTFVVVLARTSPSSWNVLVVDRQSARFHKLRANCERQVPVQRRDPEPALPALAACWPQNPFCHSVFLLVPLGRSGLARPQTESIGGGENPRARFVRQATRSPFASLNRDPSAVVRWRPVPHRPSTDEVRAVDKSEKTAFAGSWSYCPGRSSLMDSQYGAVDRESDFVVPPTGGVGKGNGTRPSGTRCRRRRRLPCADRGADAADRLHGVRGIVRRRGARRSRPQRARARAPRRRPAPRLGLRGLPLAPRLLRRQACGSSSSRASGPRRSIASAAC